jgi:two-component system, OmpR family, phosphate regulon sensor histidine kinase PhoR
VNLNRLSYKLILGLILIVLCVVIASTLQEFMGQYPLVLAGVSSGLGIFLGLGFFHIISMLAKPIQDDYYTPIIKRNDKFGRISRQRFARAAIDAMNNPIIILDGALHLIIANNVAKKRFGINRFGARLEVYLRAPEILGAVETAISTREQQQLNFEHHFPSQTYDRVDIATFEYENQLRVVLIFNDETDLRKSELMRVDFLANAGHELRTPLASIRGFIETMQFSAKDDKKAAERFLPIMAREAERMHRLIEDIFSLSKIEFNEHVPPKSNRNMVLVTESVLNALEPISKNSGRKINFTRPKDIFLSRMDEDEIHQVLNNLLENAIKYGAPDTDISIKIENNLDLEQVKRASSHQYIDSSSLSLVLPEDNGQKFVLVRVENYGKGIAAHYMPRLSERFYRIDDESAHIRGTGLGLAIVKHILKRHNGSLIIESKVGDKTAFSFAIPCA